MNRRRAIPLALAATAALAAPAGAGAPTRKTVELFDNYYLPAKLTVGKGSTITWKWPDDVSIDVHDVKLESGPKGVKKFHSEPSASGYRYRRKLAVPGTYKLICTLHEEMKMTIKVHR